MKYIIELPEDVKEKFDNATKDDIYGNYYDYNSVLGNAIKNSTLLPKGHGDLIDRKALINNGIQKGFCDWYDEIKYAPTIIEADKGE